MPKQLAEYQRIRQRTLRGVDAESLSHAQGTPEHVKEMQQTGPRTPILRVGRMSLMRRGVGL